MTPSRNQKKELLRQEIEQHTDEYLRRGGKVIVGSGQATCQPIGKVKSPLLIRRAHD